MLELTTFQGDLDADGFDGDAQLLDFGDLLILIQFILFVINTVLIITIMTRARTRPDWDEEDENEANLTMVDMLTDGVSSQVTIQPHIISHKNQNFCRLRFVERSQQCVNNSSPLDVRAGGIFSRYITGTDISAGQ